MKKKNFSIKKGLTALLLPFAFYLLPLTLKAQIYVTAPMTGTPNPGEYYSNSQIAVLPVFHFAPTTGQRLHLYTNSDCALLATTPSPDKNYIITSVPRKAGYNPVTTGYTSCDVSQTIQYFDGLGRAVQTVQVMGSPANKDVVQPIAYDQFGREATKYLPYALTTGTSNGSYKTDALTGAQSGFYNPGNTTATQQANGVVNTSYPSATSVFEPSPLNRVVEQGAPGASWQPGGHTVKISYGTNAATDVILWTVNSTANGLTGGSTNYTAGVLYTTTTTDENGFNTIEFKDNEGHVVCKKAQLTPTGNNYTATYYVYNDLGNLSYVIPPNPSGAAYPATILETDATFINYIYGYHYDTRNRLIEKKIPGKGWEFMVYNRIDQVIFTQDAAQRSKTPQEWTYMKYDALARVAITGLWSSGTLTGSAGDSNIASPSHVLQQWLINWAVNNLPVLWVSRDNTQPTGYSYIDPAGPVLSLNYYDDYNGIPNLPAAFSPTGYSSMTKGLPTVTATAVLNTIYNATPDMLYTVHCYDDLGRVVKTYQQHYLGGATALSQYNYDVITNAYNFSNQVTSVTRQHYKNVSNVATLNVTVANTYVYDHVGRKTQTFEKINSGTNILLAQSDYNPIGQLTIKHLHSTTGAAPFLQDIKYKYNERGWLKRINDPALAPSATRMFSEQLNYDSVKYGAIPNYNGNISEQDYNAAISTRQHVVYAYDPLNRLNSGTSTASLSETDISYDNLGNITSLTRGTNTGTYGYTNGSQLQSISGITTSNYTYDLNGNVFHDGRNNATVSYNLLNLPQTVNATTPAAINITYTYDASGKKLRKVSTAGGITTNTDYIDGIQYKTDAATIDFIQTEEGRANNSGTSFTYEYTLTDQLGNNRVTFDQTTGKVGEEEYYPFGLNLHRQVNATNKYLYNKKEIQEELGQYDYGARFYDPMVGRWMVVDPMADMTQNISPYVYCVNNPILFVDRFGLDTLKEVKITATRIVNQILETALYYTRPIGMPRHLFWKPKRTDKAGSFEEMAHNAIITYSSKTILTGNLLEKLKKDPAFQAWRKKILEQYKVNPLIKHYLTVIKFGGQPFFSTNGDTEVKLSVRGAGVVANFTESNGGITVNYQLNDTFDLDYQAGRGPVYNGINGFLKPIWVGVLDGRDDMKVQGNWSETIKQ